MQVTCDQAGLYETKSFARRPGVPRLSGGDSPLRQDRDQTHAVGWRDDLGSGGQEHLHFHDHAQFGSGSLGAPSGSTRFPRSSIAGGQTPGPPTTLTACHGSFVFCGTPSFPLLLLGSYATVGEVCPARYVHRSGRLAQPASVENRSRCKTTPRAAERRCRYVRRNPNPEEARDGT